MCVALSVTVVGVPHLPVCFLSRYTKEKDLTIKGYSVTSHSEQIFTDLLNCKGNSHEQPILIYKVFIHKYKQLTKNHQTSEGNQRNKRQRPR